jgi:Zinc carboxypeptidase
MLMTMSAMGNISMRRQHLASKPHVRRLATSLVVLGLMCASGAGAQTTSSGFVPGAELGGLGQIPSISADFYAPGTQYDPAIPSPQSVLGYRQGERLNPSREVERYFTALATALPNRVKLETYGQSWQGKRLYYVVIGTPERLANLGAIQADAMKLADPRTLGVGEAEAIMARHPAIVWLANTVHGDEPSPSDASVQLAYHLLAAQNDPRVTTILRETLIVIVPVQNPDGRDNFITANTTALGLEPTDSALSAERDQPWPGGRVNHAIMDLNRDWFAQTQPETRAHTNALMKWYPVAMVDAHEMGTDQSFFFPPEADPINPNVPAEQRALRDVIGRTVGRAFDQIGVGYFTREVFDLFYPGYGDGWPTAQGTVSMTYEQGSARGLLAQRSNGTKVTYAETVRNHFVASLATLDAVANNSDRFVRAFHDFRRTAIQEGRTEATKAYVIPAQRDGASVTRLAGLLTRQGIEVTRADTSFSACGKTYAAGAHIVSAAQPTKRLIRNLLEREVALDPKFITEQERRRKAGLPDQIYDVTAWSLPLLYNVDVDACSTLPAVRGALVGPELVLPGGIERPEATTAFVVDAGSAASGRFMTAALKAGVRLRKIEEGFTLEGRTFSAGSLVATRGDNDATLGTRLSEIARTSGARVVGFDSSWVTQGPSLGSSRSVLLRQPKIALAWDLPIDRYSAGATRYILERKFGVPVTPIRARRMSGANLDQFDVVILPDNEASYGATFTAGAVRNLKGFVQRGGVLIGLGGAVEWMSEPDTNLSALRREQAVVSEAQSKARPALAKPKDGETTIEGALIGDDAAYANAIAERAGDPTALDGAIVRAVTNPEHWLSAGLSPQVHFMMTHGSIYRPLTQDQGENVVRFDSADKVTASGVVWEDNRKQMAYKPVVAVERDGRGYVISFTIDPTYRAQTDGLDGLLLNAIYGGVARARPTR